MKGVHKPTAGEISAQRAKRERRYANSMGNGYCMLTRRGVMCPDRTVRQIGDTFVCQHHWDLIEAIKRDAKQVRSRKPSTRLARSIA